MEILITYGLLIINILSTNPTILLNNKEVLNMKIEFEKLLKFSPLTAVLFAVLALIIPIPAKVAEILLGIELIASIGLLIYSFMKNRFHMPSFLLCFHYFALAANVVLTKATLLGRKNGNQIPVIQLISEYIEPHFFILCFIFACILLLAQLFAAIKGAGRTSEVAARFVLNSMNEKMFAINYNFSSGNINEAEKNKQQTELRKEIDFYSSMDGLSKLLTYFVIANIILALINIIGGIVISDSIKNVISITSINMIAFAVPMLISEFAANIAATGDLEIYKIFRKDPSVTNKKETIAVNEFTLELGYELINLVDKDKNAPLVIAITRFRKELTDLPMIRIVDNMELDSNEYKVHWNDKEIKNKLLQTDSTDNKVARIIQDIRSVFELNKS